MADQALGGTLAQGADLSLTCPAADGDWITNFILNSNWSTAKAGDSLVSYVTDMIAGAGLISGGVYDGNYIIYRTHLLFNIPSNLVRVDAAPQLKVYSHTGYSSVTITSNAYSNPSTPISGLTATSLWDNVQTGASALYKATTGTLATNAYNTIDLDANAVAGEHAGLAAYHCVTKAGTAMIISIINRDHDQLNSAPPDNNDHAYMKKPSTVEFPSLILRDAWFKDTSGAAQKYEGDYVINAYNPNLDSYHKTVDQVPFGLNIKGPISLRGTDNAYKTTRK